ncbi:helix-turn-helix transcriptional regulator [Kitasatospora sp. NPDC088783]|uniref:helix-turn-helix transcriptional regulator n=1 Tax=Kitasatospora sp. NPDC088783 TaxID=3364077 RepID=UPI0037F1DFC1
MPARQFDGSAFQAVCSERALTPQNVADQVGVSRATVGNWLKGRAFPELHRLPALAKILGKPLDVAFPRSGEPDLADLRNDAGHTQKTAAEAIGMNTHIAVARAEQGTRRLAAGDAALLAELYKVTADELAAAQDRSFGEAGQAEPEQQSFCSILNELYATDGRPGAELDSLVADKLNARAKSPSLTAGRVAGLRSGEITPHLLVADAGVLFDVLGQVLDVSPAVFKQRDELERQLQDTLLALSALQKGDVRLAARGGEGRALGRAMMKAAFRAVTSQPRRKA